MSSEKEGSNKRKWSEINKNKKEEKRKWKEHNLMKKIEKRSKKQNDQVSETSLKSTEEGTKSCLLSTVTIAVPGSILENAQSPELRTYLSGQIARAACIFQVDEIVVFDDYGDEANSKKSTIENNEEFVIARQSCVQLGRILQYLECPQYLRKSFFPIHNDLKYCGILNPLNAPHHMTPSDKFLYREGVVLSKPVKSGQGSFVNVGLLKEIHVDKLLAPGIRCTVQLLPPPENSKKLKGIVVSPMTPRKETGIYWGYSVRIATSLSKVFSQCPYAGYDLIIGTSDQGTSVDEFKCPKYKHLLIMFGGLQGLEAAIENDPVLQIDDPKLLFDHYLNTLPDQGSRTIRTEEAILVSMAALRPKLNPEGKCVEFKGYCEDSTEPVMADSASGENVHNIGDMSRFD